MGVDSISKPGVPSRPGSTSMNVEFLVAMTPPPSDSRYPDSMFAERAKPFHPKGGVSTTDEPLAERGMSTNAKLTAMIAVFPDVMRVSMGFFEVDVATIDGAPCN